MLFVDLKSVLRYSENFPAAEMLFLLGWKHPVKKYGLTRGSMLLNWAQKLGVDNNILYK